MKESFSPVPFQRTFKILFKRIGFANPFKQRLKFSGEEGMWETASFTKEGFPPCEISFPYFGNQHNCEEQTNSIIGELHLPVTCF